MSLLVWDEIGTHFYEAGVDRGVLYLPDGNGVPWNGLINVTESSENQATPVYFDGIKYADILTFGDFSGTIKAYTYPDEFLQFEGILEVGNGLFVNNQQPNRFNLSYRTRIGNDIDENYGYKIHILYNLIATPSEKSYDTMSVDKSAIEFEWSISAIPDKISGFKPTAHLIIDSRKMGPLLLQDIEDTLYGNEFDDAKLPPLSTLTSFIDNWVIIRITENGDGTWTATGPDNLITMLDATTFQIIQANARYLDADTYLISDLTY